MQARWQVIIAVMLICVLVFFVANSVLAKFTVEKPLYKALHNHSEVLEFQVKEDKDLTKIFIALDNTTNPFHNHKELENIINEIINQEFIIIYKHEIPKENTLEWNQYWRVNAIITEALITNNYISAIEQLDQILEQDTYYLFVHENQLFVNFNIGEINYFSVYNLERGA